MMAIDITTPTQPCTTCGMLVNEMSGKLYSTQPVRVSGFGMQATPTRKTSSDDTKSSEKTTETMTRSSLRQNGGREVGVRAGRISADARRG